VAEPLRSAIHALSSEIVTWRRDLHQHPELGFEERRTQRVVRRWLERHGFKARTCAETGLVADLQPGASGRTIALRADLDALPLQESGDLAYRSVHDGVAHACGHDGHTTMLMGTAAMLARHRDELDGNVRLLFQPAEEGVRGGGAAVMVSEGALEGVDEVYGLHSWPAWPRGELRIATGPMMAQVHDLAIRVRGTGGHGSQPQLCRDPIVAASQLVGSLQTVVSRGVGSDGGAVVSVCSFHSGTANNIIPDNAELTGTIRTFSEAITARVLERIDEIARGTSAGCGVDVEVEAIRGYPVLVNDRSCVDTVARLALEVPGVDRVLPDGLPMAGGEDFAYFAEQRPSAFFFLGAGRGGEDTPSCHHSEFDFDDELIPVGIELFLRIVSDRLSR
jgi:amidohydrolase